MGKLLGGSSPKKIEVPSQDAASIAADDAKRRGIAANAEGYGQTILSGGQGVSEDPNAIKKKSLLGA
jgi:hypothetical protein